MGVRRLLRVAVLTVMLAISLVSGTLPAAAQSNGSASGLSISPTRADYTIKPGQADKLDITLKNVTSGEITAKPIVNDFTSDNKTGSPKIITDPSIKSTASIKSFLIGLDNVVLAKGEQKKVTISIQMPTDVPPGAYFGLVRYEAVQTGVSAPQPGEVALSASVSTVVLITVPGKITDKVQLLSVAAYRGGVAGWFFTHQPTQAGVEVKNLGNGFAEPFGRVSIQDFRSREVYSYEMNGNQPRSNVLPGSSRLFLDDVKNIKAPGRYTVVASISYANGSDVLISKATFWYIPWWLVGVIIIVLLALLFVTWTAWRRFKRGTHKHSR